VGAGQIKNIKRASEKKETAQGYQWGYRMVEVHVETKRNKKGKRRGKRV